MNKLKIKTEFFPERCDICHQTDCFDPVKNHCARCSQAINEKPAINWSNEKSLKNSKRPGITTLNQVTDALHLIFSPFKAVGVGLELVSLTILALFLVFLPPVVIFLLLFSLMIETLGVPGLYIGIILLFYITFRLWIYFQHSFR